MWFLYSAIDNFTTNWTLYFFIIVLFLVTLRAANMLKNWFFSFIVLFTIPGTISFVMLMVSIIYFYSNGFKADLIIVELLALIVVNFHLPKILDIILSKITNMKNLRIGNIIADFDIQTLRTNNQLPLSQQTVIFHSKDELIQFFISVGQKLDTFFILKFPNEIIPNNKFEIVQKLANIGVFDMGSAVILNTIINLSDLLYLGYQPQAEEIEQSVRYCQYSLDYLDKKIEDTR